jgi:dTMP kinase
LFVTFEGIEASGKSTLLEALAERLRSDGISLVTTREPGGTPLGARIRQLVLAPNERVAPAAEALLMTADRAQHVAELIRPALAQGTWVLCDRFATATLAYQGYGHGVPLEDLRPLIAVATGGLEPDIVLLVDIPVEISQERVKSRSAQSGRLADRMERENGEFHTRVREGYLALASEDAKIHVLDGLQPVETLLRKALEIVRARSAAS